MDLESKRLFGPAAAKTEEVGELACSRVIEAFLVFARTRLLHRRLADTNRFGFHLKECEFRFNHSEEDLYQLMLKMFRENPLN